MNIWDFVTIICVFIICVAVGVVFEINNENKLAVVAVETGLQQCVEKSGPLGKTVVVWKLECSK